MAPKPGRTPIYPFREMALGDEALVPWDGSQRRWLNVYYATRRKPLAGRKFLLRGEGEWIRVMRSV